LFLKQHEFLGFLRSAQQAEQNGELHVVMDNLLDFKSADLTKPLLAFIKNMTNHKATYKGAPLKN
jgi:hypothetical protein